MGYQRSEILIASDFFSGHLMILIFTVLVSIILMNLLVGLAVSDIQVIIWHFIFLKFYTFFFAERQILILMVGANFFCVPNPQPMIDAKLSQHRFQHCFENRLIKTIPTTPHNLHLSTKSGSLYCG